MTDHGHAGSTFLRGSVLYIWSAVVCTRVTPVCSMLCVYHLNRCFHVDVRSGAYASAHALPDPSSAKLATYFAGEEIVALAEQGDWLQVPDV